MKLYFQAEIETVNGPALLIGVTPDKKQVLVCYSTPKELRGRLVGPCRNVFVPIKDVQGEAYEELLRQDPGPQGSDN